MLAAGLVLAAVLASATTAGAEETKKPIGPYVTMGAGAAALVTGIVIIAAAPSVPSNCNEGTSECTTTTKGAPITSTQLQHDQSQAEEHVNLDRLGIIVSTLGVIALAAGVTWFLLDDTSSRTASITPWITADSGGVSAFGRF